MASDQQRQAVDDALHGLTAALRATWQACEALEEPPLENGVRAGTNLPELLAAALQQLAKELGGTDHLVEHRPGSWEAQHVRALGYLL